MKRVIEQKTLKWAWDPLQEYLFESYHFNAILKEPLRVSQDSNPLTVEKLGLKTL